MAAHIKKGDMVIVIAGADKDRAKPKKVINVDYEKGSVLIEGVNLVKKHVRPSKQNPQGGRLSVEKPIHISNVLPYNPKTKKATRVRFVIEGKKKSRVAVDDGSTLDVIKK